MKHAKLLALITLLLLVLAGSPLAQASNGLAVLNNSADVDFPSSITFSLSASSDIAITDIRLHYQVNRMSHAQVTSEIYIEVIPDAAIDTEWNWDMRMTGGLPPGSSVNYWWTVQDAANRKVATDMIEIRIDDDNYNWQSLTEGKVTLYWYQGDESFAKDLMMAAQQALVRLAEFTGAELEKSVEIYIYANSRDLQGSMIFPQEWTGGVAFTRYGIIAIGISTGN
ncbi:peptidase MA family metallohydrolase, partial [Chloroflexota bacterium]